MRVVIQIVISGPVGTGKTKIAHEIQNFLTLGALVHQNEIPRIKIFEEHH